MQQKIEETLNPFHVRLSHPRPTTPGLGERGANGQPRERGALATPALSAFIL